MINRVLIRMKAVQLLYSYLLVDKPFMLESQPTAPTKEKRFAYGLYLDLIYLMIRISRNVTGKGKAHPLTQSRFIIASEEDERMKPVLIQYQEAHYPFSKIEGRLSEIVKDSLLFREYEKNLGEGKPNDNFWENIFRAIIMPDAGVNDIIKEIPGYSLSGVDRMIALMDATFKNFYSSKGNLTDALKTLEMSLQKARDLYMRLLSLPVELTSLRLRQLEQNRNKLLASVEDLNPNMRLVNNRIPAMIEENEDYRKYMDEHHINWTEEDPELLPHLLKAVLDSDVYSEYVSSSGNNIARDSEFWRTVLTEVILENQYFLEYLENKSVFWNDDLEIMTSFVVKTIKRLENPDTANSAVLPMYKDGDSGRDARFGAELFNYVVNNKELYRKYIQDVLAKDKWEADRLAFMDIVITMTALAEIINYPEIPVTVSINEYIEIAKSYSSAKSGQFIHGLLASLIEMLRAEKIILK